MNKHVCASVISLHRLTLRTTNDIRCSNPSSSASLLSRALGHTLMHTDSDSDGRHFVLWCNMTRMNYKLNFLWMSLSLYFLSFCSFTLTLK